MSQESKRSEESWFPFLFYMGFSTAALIAGYLYGFKEGEAAGIVAAPEYVAVEIAEIENETEWLQMREAKPADRYEMCDRIMDMASDILLSEEMEARREMDEHAREAEGEIHYR